MPKAKQDIKSKLLDSPVLDSPETVQKIKVTDIFPSLFEPQNRRRAHFKTDELEKLAESIKTEGLIQPIVVRTSPGLPGWEIIAGERRWLASKLAGLTEISALVRELSDERALEIQLKENLNRLEPNPLDEAYSFKYFIEYHKLTPADVAAKFGRSENLVLRRLKLNSLIKEVIADMETEGLSLGHAEEIALYPPHSQKEILESCVYKWNNKDYRYEPLDKLRRNIADKIVLRLANAVFDTTATDLHPNNLACVNCHEQTGFEPGLFDLGNGITKDVYCLNKPCFKSKEQIHFDRLKVNFCQEYGAEKPVFASESWVYDSDKKKFGEGDYNNRVEFLESAECDSSRPAISVDSESLGQVVYFCDDENCSTHNEDEVENDGKPSAQSLKNQEEKFRVNLQNSVQEKIISDIGNTLKADNPFWQNQDWVKQLLFIALEQHEFRNNLRDFAITWKNYTTTLYDDDQRQTFVNSLDSDQIQQILFYSVFGKTGYSHWNIVSQSEIKQLAKNFSNLDYDLLFAETLLANAPEDGKEKAEDYLAKVQAGESVEIPYFYLTEEMQSELEDDGDEDEDDELEDEDDWDTEDEETEDGDDE